MESKLSLREFKSNLEMVKAAIADTATKNVMRIEFRTFDEGMCEADLFVLPKREVADEFEAFVTLCTYQLHFYEEWLLTDTTSEEAESIVNLWMQPEVEGFLFKPLSPAEVHKEIDWIIDSILRLLSDQGLSKKRAKYPERWGVYVNGEPISNKTTLEDLGVHDIVSGIGFDLVWNSIQIMYQTADDYVFFSWSTGA